MNINTPSRIIIYAFLIMTSIVIFSCAKSALPLGGGDEDETPPGIDSTSSTMNKQTNWDGSDIEIEFDEWVELKDKSGIIVSPPLKYSPEVELKGKKVTFAFHEDEELKENTTYVINFGQSITDFTAGNPTDNLVYVMSTGDVIDSLSIRGRVIDAYTGAAVPDVLVQAYDVNSDSILMNERPFYATVTKEDGTWELTNLKADTFQLFALGDKNLNYQYDGIEEQVGFLDSMIIVKYDTIPSQYILTAFSMTTVDVQEVIHRNNQHLKLKLSSEDDGFTLNSETNQITYQTQVKDSVFVWFDTVLDSNSVVTFTTLDSLIHDTLSWRRPQETIDSLIFLSQLSTQPSQTYPGDSIVYVFQNPIKQVDASKVELYTVMEAEEQPDSTTIAKDTIPVEVQTTYDGRSLFLKYNSKAAQQYTLNLFPGAVTDLYGQTNDTIPTIFLAKGKDNFSKITVSFTSSDNLSTYAMELYNSKEIKIMQLNLKNGDKIDILGLLPDEYNAKLIKDNNLNGKWDTGDLLTRRQPEEIKSIPIEKLRENWDIELNIDWDNL